jgi:two-component system response regulator MprA/two-component system response regulator TrcR
MMRYGTQRILVISGDGTTARMIQQDLDQRGFDVFTIGEPSSILPSIETLRPGVVVLEGLSPGFEAGQLRAMIRRKHGKLPIITMTASDRPPVYHDGGADDFISKPFNGEVLEAQIRALLRRTEGDAVVRIGDLDINTSTHEVYRGEQRIRLTGREYDLLEYLARNARRVLSRDMILDRVWHHTPDVDPNVLDVYIGYLRKKIERPGQPRLIQTIRGMGFALREA